MLRFLFWVFEVDIWKNIQSALTLTFLTQGTWERVKKSKEEKNRWAVPLLSQFSARTLRKERKREKDGGPEWKNKERWRQWITPNSNEIKQSDTEEQETENRNQPDRKLKQKNYLTLFFHRYFVVFIQPRKHSVSDTDRHRRGRQADTERLMGTESTTRHSRHASWLPQVFVFTHEEHLNIKLQKHVSTLAHLSVTPLRLDNSTRPINEKPQRCANLLNSPNFLHRTSDFPFNHFLF